jgi:hypothetical protein
MALDEVAAVLRRVKWNELETIFPGNKLTRSFKHELSKIIIG